MFRPHTFLAPGGKLPYQLLEPTAPAPPGGLPLVLFLHGAGERGADNQAQLRHGVCAFVAGQKQHPAVIVAPQCPEGRRWVEVPWDAPSHRQPKAPSVPLAAALALVQELVPRLSINSRRLYITGLSMGGYGTWDAITRFPERFAAAVPVCGGGDVTLAPRIARLPLWAFHGSKDEVVKVERSREMIGALGAAGGAPRYSEYADLPHDCWTRAYAEPGLFPWLFSQTR